MFNSGSNYSLADIAAATGSNRDGDNGWGGGSGAWWIIILFLFCFMGGWGNGGRWGGNGSAGCGGGYPYPVYVGNGGTTREEISYGFDMNGLETGIRGVQNGLCDGFYSINTTLLNGFHGVDNAICTIGYNDAQLANGIQNTVQQGNNATQVALMQGFNGVQAGQTALGTQLAQCCCDNKAALADIKYTIATDTCALNTNLATQARNIIDNDNANFRAIDARLTQMEMNAKDDKIATLLNENQSLRLAASQCAQNELLIDRLGPKVPVAAYQVPNPFVPYGYGNCCGNTCCG